ncbi:hypothetical protein ACH5RR_033257 [Cinchona calisaya]
MHEMEESVRSGGVVKKKSSSGCLIIKKKAEVLGGGAGSSHNENKRARLINSDSGSSDESLEPVRRGVNDEIHNGPVVYGRRSEEERELRNGGIMESERKRGRLDLFDFDEYDEFDGKRMRNDYGEMGSGSSREFGGGSSRNMMVEKRSKMYFDRSGGGVSGRNKVVDYGGERRFATEDDEAHLPISLLRLKYAEESAEPIRLQGKNGVLKVMVNKKKNMDLSSRKRYGPQEVEIRKGSRSEDVVKKEPLVPPFYSDSKRPDKRIAFVEKEKSQLKLHSLGDKSNQAGDCGGVKSEPKLQKQMLGKSTKDRDHKSDGSDTSLKLAPPNSEPGSSKKAVKREAKGSSTTGNVTPVKSIEHKVSSPAETPVKGIDPKLKRSGSTEKQLLRERIREMLIKSGWKIDYRPRRNRDYLDAVYINPSGTAYWSIIKAYDALQKQLQDGDGGSKPDGVSSSFSPLSDDLINKLTRQTRKKIEEEMNKKRRVDGLSKNAKMASVKESTEDSDSDQNDEKLSSFIRQNGKPKKGRLHEVKSKSGDDLGDDFCRQKPEQEMAQKPFSVIQGRKSRKIGRCTLLVRSSEKGQNSESDGYVPYTGKRTLLAWLIDSGTVQLSEKVQYMNRRRTRAKLEGWITRDGIHCGCCSKILTVSKFELHAGSKLRQPFQNIILETGPSLLQCLIDTWNRQEESVRRDFYVVDVDGDDPDDDTCGICGDGGDLICCDGCPSTFHQNCLGIQMLPPGDWHCPNCTCKFCGAASGSPNENNVTSSELFMCILCEKKYHKSCSDGMVAPMANANNSIAFCGKKCQEIYDQLQKILGVKNELEAGFSWSLIQRTDLESDTASRGFPQRVECNSKLAVALCVMDECFLPIIDRRSGINLIHNVLYNCGANFSRLNYCGFFTVVLEKGDEIISAASIRIHGPQLAEMPFIGTRNIYRRQGMCRRLLSAIESVLCSLKVEKLIIPAIAEHMHTWTVVFGFKQLQDLDRKEMKSMNMLVFPGTDMLQKQLLKQEIPNGVKGFHSKDNLLQSPSSVEKPDESSQKQEMNIPCGVGSLCKNKVIDKAETDPVSSASTVHSNDRAVAGASEAADESAVQISSNDIGESQPVKDIGESSGSLKCSSPSGAAADPPEIESSVLDSPAKDNIPSSANNVASDSPEVNAQVSSSGSIVDFPGKISENMVEDADENQNPVSVAIHDNDGNCIPSSTNDLPSEAHKMNAHEVNAQVSSSGSILDFPGKTSENMVEDADENQNPGSVATVHDSDENCIQNHRVQQPTVVEIQREFHTYSEASSDTEFVPDQGNIDASGKGSDGAVSEPVAGSVTVETIPNSFPETSSQNDKEKAFSKQNFASDPLHFTGRVGEVKRVAKETNVFVKVNLDGDGVAGNSTGIPFLDHIMLDANYLIDDYHTNEDVALALGTALLEAVRDRKGINRFGDFSAPLDEALIHVALGLSGRPRLSFDQQIPIERVGTYDTQLVEHFFQLLVNTSRMTLHIWQLAGKNSHHIIEATFKAFARALRQATEYDSRGLRRSVPRFCLFTCLDVSFIYQKLYNLVFLANKEKVGKNLDSVNRELQPSKANPSPQRNSSFFCLRAAQKKKLHAETLIMSVVANEEFQHILRIQNTNVDGKQKVMFALTSIKGIGRRFANIVCKKADVDMNKRAGELSAAEIDNLMTIVANPRQFKIPDWFLNRQKDYKDGKYSQVVSNALDMKLRDDLERLKKIRNHRGLRHYWGLRVRGQHTKTTGRRGKTVGVSKKR